MMKTSRKTNVGLLNICVHIWRQLIVIICIASPYLIYPVVVGPFTSLYFPSVAKDPTSLREIKSKYPSQNDSFWRTFESGVNDVLQFNQPTKIVVMYRPQFEKFLDSILQDLSTYMVRKLEAVDSGPIIVEAHELNEPPFSEDYGEVLSKFGEELRTRPVMIVKNIDKVAGKVARAFHFLCDQYTPYVERAVIIFTLQVDKFPNRDDLFVENLLRNVWTDIEEDTFSPLITRILSIILRVNDATSLSNKLLSGSWISIQLVPIFIGFVLCLVLYLIRRSYTDIACICYDYPCQRESIWENLSNVSVNDHFFMFSSKTKFLAAVLKYLLKELHLSHVITLNEKDMENIDRYFKKNKTYLESGCILVIDNIEEVQGKLRKLFCTNDVKTILNTYKFPIIYTVAGENTEEQESVLEERFMKLLPTKKVFS